MNRLETTQIEQLALAAREAQHLAYVPYSHFPVGAAVLGANGQMYTGANVENASYPLTMCAERIALYRALMDAAGVIRAISIITPTTSVASPCGACRQVMYELAPEAQVVLLSEDGHYEVTTVKELLPHGFGATQLTTERM
ncbi:MAG: cytidine deaminase [Oscillochloris sp.]|nr:cytidine deaminase [Oscillochloris sp.]